MGRLCHTCNDYRAMGQVIKSRKRAIMNGDNGYYKGTGKNGKRTVMRVLFPINISLRSYNQASGTRRIYRIPDLPC